MTENIVGFVALSAASALTGFPPASGPNLLAGSLFGPLLGTACFMLGTMLGSVVSFALVRTVLRGWLMRRMASYAPQWKGIDLAIAREGAFFIVMLLRLSPAMPLAIANAVLGLTSVGFVPYALGTACGLLPFSFIYVYVGSLGKQMTEGAGLFDDPLQLALTVAGLVTTAGLTWKISKVATAALDAAQQAAPAAAPAAANGSLAATRPRRRATTPKRLGVQDGFGDRSARRFG